MLNDDALTVVWHEGITPPTDAEIAVAMAAMPSDFDLLKQELIAKVDDALAAIQSKWTRFQAEYQAREAAARDYQAGGYVGTAPALVHDYATESGKTDKEAAAIIIAQADALQAALVVLGGIRMRKNRILNAATEADARAQFEAIIAAAANEAAKIK